MKNDLSFHTHKCPSCSGDYDPNWFVCQRCGSPSEPVKKDLKNFESKSEHFSLELKACVAQCLRPTHDL